ncbi:structural maintenance of chromosomes protein 4-like [Microplitis mediator]|uniref:structural maintenance of chromosomes protein 4-like n=1 Tax=Microplitis mediator TaxID=375433 RepID=UPI00255622E0|nr:structural maintenance of chromosomes protein 4-like [Microplitis mediator]
MAGRNKRSENMPDDMDVDPADTTGLESEEGGLRVDEDIYIPPAPKIYHANENNGPRLIIEKIVNRNFKSYADIVVIGPFHQCFTSIVGPNGSGKSNIIDAMLFVFGYRASKIRSKKISELIHRSGEHPNISSCTVAVYFQKVIDLNDEERKYEVVPNSRVVISKTAFKDNTSFYELNGKKVQFREIAKLLRDEGVDLDHNRFLILQGEVEQIALMKPKAANEHDCGMLEFLEDIIGTSRYKEPLEKLAVKVERSCEVVTEKLNRLRIVEHERDELKEPMELAVNYMKCENVITKLQHQLYHCKKAECESDAKKHEERHEEICEDCKNLKVEMNKVVKDKQLKSEELKAKTGVWDEIQRRSDTVTVKFDKLRKKDENLHQELVETNKRRKGNMATVKAEKEKLEQLQNVPEKSAKDIKECESLIEKHLVAQKKEEAALENLMSTLHEKTEPLMKKRVEYEAQLMSHRKKIDMAQAAFNLADSELQLYTSVEKVEKEKLEKLQSILRETAETFKERQATLAELKTKIPATEKNLLTMRNKLDEMKVRDGKVTTEIKRMRMQVEEKKSAMHATRSHNRILDALMREKREGRLPGILGRLGDLGAINSRYDVAVSTACGRLDNIVVDSVDTAQNCIEFLRVNNIGRGVFIALDKIQRLVSQCQKKITTPENTPRLFDLITVEDPRVLPAFYYGLYDTLVANDLEQASRIGYGAKRYRVVTLKGELIETSGTMSGGGRTVFRGKMGQRIVKDGPSAAEIEKLEKTLRQVNDECLELRTQQQPLEIEINKMTAELNEMRVNNNKYSLDVRSMADQLPKLKAQLKIQEKKAASAVSNPAKVKELTKAVDKAKKELEEVQQQSQVIESKVAKVNKQINELTGERIKEQQKSIQKIVKAIDKAKDEVCRLQVSIKTSVRNTQKTRERIDDLESDIKNCEARIHEIQEEKRKYEDDAKALLVVIEECADKLKDRDDLTVSLRKELQVLQEREDKMKAVKIDLDQKLGDNKKVIAEVRQRISDYERKISALKLNDIPGETPEELKSLSDDDVADLDARTLAANLAAAKERLPESVPSMQVIQDYLQKDAVFLKRLSEVDEASGERNKIRASYEMIKRRRHDEFFVGFSVINSKLKEMYQMITLGGAADLEFVDSLDPFTEGVIFSVRPPKKSWKNITNLSGGEKTLSSLALVFALHHYKPTPLYFMDEIDAALDFKNVSIVGTYIKDRTKNAQFIVVSLRSEMFELADTLVGIFKTHNATKCAAINMKVFSEKHPQIAQKEKERQERFMTNAKRGSQIKKIGCSQPLPSTCPAALEQRSNVSDTSPTTSSKRDMSNVLRRQLQSPKSKKMRRSALRRGLSVDCLNLSSPSKSSAEDVEKKKRRVDLFKK